MSQQRFVIEKLFNIHNKSAELVPFKFNNVQVTVDDLIDYHNRVNIVKFRQGGITTEVMGLFLTDCMTKYCRCVMLAHDRDSTEKMLRRAQLMLKNLKGPQPHIERMNANEIIFKKTDASFYIGTAGSKQFGRGDTITHLHGSEVAFWPDPEHLLAGLLQAVPYETGKVIYESTGNGWGTWHQRFFYKCMRGETKYAPLFLPWYIFLEYQSRVDARAPFDEHEIELIEKYNVSLKQLQWRREKIEELSENPDIGLQIFKQEYPTTVADAFRLSGGSLFNLPELENKPEWQRMEVSQKVCQA